MKRLILILLCFTQYCAAAPFKITGKIDKPVVPYLIFHSQNLPAGRPKTDTVRLDASGNFSYVLEINRGTFLPVYIEVDAVRRVNVLGFGDHSLTINLPSTGKEAIFTGSMAKIQQFAAADAEYWKSIYAAYLRRNPDFEKKEFIHTDAYFKIQDSITADRINNLKLYFKDTQEPVELTFLKYRATSFIYSDLYYKQSYPDVAYEKYKFYQDLFKVRSDYTYKYSGLVNFNDPALCYIEYYKEFVNSFLISELYNRRQKNHEQFYWVKLIPAGFKLIDELSSDPAANEGIKIAFLVYLVEELERNKNVESAIGMQEEIKISKVSNAMAMQQISSRLHQVITNNKLKKGNPVPDFQFTDTLGNKVKLADFKGKRLVIDVAASWCGPCIEGIPEWNKKVEENKDQETVYIFLSLDNTEEEGLSLFRKRLPKGKLLFAGNGGFKSKFAKDYEIVILPNQIIIDKAGNLESYFYN